MKRLWKAGYGGAGLAAIGIVALFFVPSPAGGDIDLTTPETRASITKVRLEKILILPVQRYAELAFSKGTVEGGQFKKLAERKLIFIDGNFDEADFTFTQLANATVNVTQMKDLKPALEQKVIDLGVFSGNIP